MRLVLATLLFLCLFSCSGAEPRGGEVPLATPPTSPPPPPSDVCHADSDCTLINNCGCSCDPALAPGRAMACSETCPGDPCVGKRAVCRSGHCELEGGINDGPQETS